MGGDGGGGVRTVAFFNGKELCGYGGVAGEE